MKKKKTEEEIEQKTEEIANEEVGSENGQAKSEEAEEGANKEVTEEKSELERIKDELAETKDKYLRLYSEFENFRRRTAKERLELTQTANENLMVDLLPVLDDMARAEKSFEQEDAKVKDVEEGFKLISNKLKKALEQKGLKQMENKQGMDFNPDLHEAITKIPAPSEDLKGKVVDVIEVGYYLKEKVIRFAKVVIGN
ncbi:MAG: nucleotide exchange factor GrpE [Bacteroidota bacterium]